jgi:hypothetical protein
MNCKPGFVGEKSVENHSVEMMSSFSVTYCLKKAIS